MSKESTKSFKLPISLWLRAKLAANTRGCFIQKIINEILERELPKTPQIGVEER